MKRAARLPRSAAWVLLLPILLSTGIVQGDAVDLASYRPQQGIVFDGSYTAARSWHVGFGESGFQFEHLVPFFLCPGAPRDTLDEVLRVAPDPGVFRITATVAVFQGFRQLLRLELPPTLAALTDDCGLLEEFESLQDFLQDVTDRTTLILSRIDILIDELRDAYCDARTAILDAPIIVSDENGYLPPLGGGGGSSGDPAPQPCKQYRQRLDALVARVDAMGFDQGICAALLDLMEGAPGWVVSRISEAGGLTADEQKFALAGIDTWLAAAENAQQHAVSRAAEIASTVATFTLESVALSCEQCDIYGASAASLPDRLDSTLAGDADTSEAVLVRWEREPLNRYVRSLWRAVRDTSDRREARELASLALSLSCIPSCRVLHVTYRGSAGIGQEYVALRAPRRRGGAQGGPWAVVVTLLQADAPLPDPTPHDQNLLFDAIDAFNALVVSARDDAHARSPGRHGRTRPWR